jgi:hypothetical protein
MAPAGEYGSASSHEAHSMSLEKPDFVIAGAAKCGTTALFDYLAQHPDVFAPALKEPAFFCPDLPGGISTIEEYRELFAGAPARSIAGEASTRYLLSKVAIAALMTHNPQMKVIVLLRNPVDAAYSLQSYAYRYGHENVADFEQAWRAQAARDRRTPRTETPKFEYLYGPTYRYAEQVRRVIDHVPQAQRLILIYEEFFADPAAHYARVLDFLKLTPPPQVNFSIVNEYVGVKSPQLEHLMRRLPGLVHSPLRPLLRAVGRPAISLLRKLNWRRREKQALRAEFRSELQNYFAADVAELERLLNRKLWWNDSFASPAAGS